MIDNRNPFSCLPAVVPRKEVAGNHFYFIPHLKHHQDLLQPSKFAGRSNKAVEIGKTVFEKNLNYFCADKAVRTSDQNAVILGSNIIQTHYETISALAAAATATPNCILFD